MFDQKQLRALIESPESYQRAVLSDRTQQSYADQWRLFERWCKTAGVSAAPASEETVVAYLLASLDLGKGARTVIGYVSAIRRTHELRGLKAPAGERVQRLVRLLSRLAAMTPLRQMRPLSVDQLAAIVGPMRDAAKSIGLRDRSILTLGFATALRRSNLAALLVSDLEFVPQGVLVRLAREKQRRDGTPRLIGVPAGTNPITCPVGSLRDWLNVRGLDAGSLYTRFGIARHGGIDDETVAKIVKRAVARIGLDPDFYAAHTLRASFITAAAEAGCTELAIAEQSGHKTLRVLQSYVRKQSVFRANAASRIGL